MIGRFAVAIHIVVCITSMTSHAIAARVVQLPKSYHGVWGWSSEVCRNRNDDGRVVIKRRSVEFFASRYEVERVQAQRSGTVRAHARVSEEGEPASSEGDIVLAHVGRTRLLIKSDGLRHIYVRCRHPAI